MSRLAHGEQEVSVPALQRRDELGELARSFSVFARNTASLEHTTRLLKEKTSQMEIDRIERQGLEEALLHSQKMKAVGQLTGGLAHDFNNLLAVIIGSLELIDPASADAPRVSRALKAAERGALLTQRLLAFSRKQSLHPHAIEMKPLLENLGELMRHSLPATLALDIEAQHPAWPAWIDVGQLENAMINLVMNARDAMEGQSGVIKIRTWNQRVTRSDGRRQDMVALEVIDHGSGMSQAIKAQVFEPFFTTKETGSGSGLGLSMVYGFVRQSGGRVEIESAPGQGTTVRLLLPRSTQPVVTHSDTPGTEETPQSDRLILVLEDEADVRQTLCEQLHQLGYITLEAETGQQALRMLEASPDIEMFISDLMLPGELSGAEVINHVRAHFPHLPLLLMSGQDLRPAHNPELPDVELLRKPFTRAQLAQALRKVAA
jgi:signal transduction histidine kinase